MSDDSLGNLRLNLNLTPEDAQHLAEVMAMMPTRRNAHGVPVVDPRARTDGVLKCPDSRQSLTFQQGWTWAKCTCPEIAKAAPAESR